MIKKYDINYNLFGGNKKENLYKQHVSEPWFTLIKLGLKTVEGRKNKGLFKEMKIGDIIEWNNEDFYKRSIKTEIVYKKIYKTFPEYLKSEGLKNCLPGVDNIKEGVSIYYKYYTKEDEAKYGVVAIKLKLIQ